MATMAIMTTIEHRWSEPSWHDLGDKKDVIDPLKPRGRVELAFRVRHNPDLVEPPLEPQASDNDDMQVRLGEGGQGRGGQGRGGEGRGWR